MKSLLVSLFVLIGFAGQSQSLVSVSPSTGAAGASVNVTITGSGTNFTNSTLFFLSSGTSILTVNNVVASSATSVQATVVIPANATSGSYSLSTLVGITPVTLANAFTVTGGGGPGASIVSVDPDEGYQGQFLQVTITGTHTTFTQSSDITAALIKAGETPITSLGVSIMDDSTVIPFFAIPEDAVLGSYTVVLTTSSNGILTKTNGFTVIANPNGTLIGVSPSQANKDVTLDVTISGSGTSFTQATVTADFYSSNSGFMLTVNETEVVNDSTILCNITVPANARSGTYDVVVMLNQMEFLQLIEGFTVIGDPSSEPHLKSVSPATAMQGAVLDVTISGANTHFTQSSGTMAAIFSQATYVEASSFNVLNDSVMTAHFEIPQDFEVGLYDFGVVTDMDGFLELLQSFTITEYHVGLKEVNEADRIPVYPNPVKDKLTFETDKKVQRVYLTDMMGRQTELPLDDFRQNNAAYSVNIEQYGVAKGVYFIKIETDLGTTYRKILIQ